MAFQTSGSLFGSKPATGTSLFGQNNSTTPQQGSLFGNTSQNTSGNPFGQTQSQPAQGSSLFGNTLGGQPNQQQQQQQPAQNSSLFGGSNQKPATSGLFGQSTNQPQQNQQQQGGFGSSLFGSSAQQNNQQQQPQSSLFGNLGTSTNNAQQQPTFGGFGSNNNQSTLGGFGASNAGGLFGNRQASQQPSLSTTQTMGGAPPFTKSTKFNDLPDDTKRLFEQIDAHIQGRIQISNDLKQRKLGDEATKGQELIYSVHQDLLNTISVIHSDVHLTRDLKEKVDQTVQDTIISTRIVDGFRNPQQYGMHLKNHADFPLEFFNRVTEEMKERLRWCKLTIEAIERKLSSAVSQTQYTPQVISSTLEAQHTTFIALASKTAALDADLQKIKSLYTQMWRAKTGSMRDPFNDLDRRTGGEFGLEGLSGK
ncbi:hypothetical protein QCA50_014432 [Cerrena zonata]|uniref:Nucleoporin p58/p45 n=1 Tax=Cerrena zonata TaxID=2478898 RepID=A0AAW0FZA6_9APHY